MGRGFQTRIEERRESRMHENEEKKEEKYTVHLRKSHLGWGTAKNFFNQGNRERSQ